MSIHGILGESTTYPTTYDPSVLYPIARTTGRDAIQKQIRGFDTKSLTLGMDWWHAFEVSWLDPQGISQMAIARFLVDANTPNITESKSLKLYLNSLNFTQFTDWQHAQSTIQNDVSMCVGADISVELFDVTTAAKEFAVATPQGRCIDEALKNCDNSVALCDQPNARLLMVDNHFCKSNTHRYHVHCHLLRSNCPVTNQPDWGTLEIDMYHHTVSDQEPYRLPQDASVLRYILSYRQHNGFHEQCVERIFADLMHIFVPTSLMVRAWYTRRGGIDINPCRVSDLSLLPKPSRLLRQ